jgi:GntR family transcriptional regulator/MocR family aminotransferase
MEIILNVNEKDTKPLYVQLYEGIRKEISEGRLEANTKIPSIRKLAKTLNMSKTTIESTYHQLLVEGYLYSVEKKGYYVSQINTNWLHSSLQKKAKIDQKNEVAVKWDLTNAYLEEQVFNTIEWKKIIDKTINEQGNTLLSQGDLQGESQLREQIVRYIYQIRGVYADASQIIIGAGIQPLLLLLSQLLVKLGRTKIGFEDPGFNRAKSVFVNSPLELIPVQVYEDGIDINSLNKMKVDVCYTSPSHQFPTGTVMPINKRTELIHWAESNNAYIIEDDYNSEIRYYGRPIPSLQGLSRGEYVVYLGSFSTVFLPSFRISYMVLPNSLLKVYEEIKNLYAQTASKLEQLAMANYMSEGQFEKHIRRLKVHYTKKSETVIKIIKSTFGQRVRINGGDSGFNLYIEIDTDKTEEDIKKGCKDKGLLLNVLSDYTVNQHIGKQPVVILSYKGIKMSDLEDAVKELHAICF